MSSQIFYRDSWVEIQLNAIKNNIKHLRNHLPQDKKIFAVVKANAYGHGDIQVAKAALEEGVYGLAVAILDEALRLRKAGISSPILVMGWVKPEACAIAAEHEITLTVFQADWIREAKLHLSHVKLAVHIKVDTGMGRIGIREQDELQHLLSEIDEEYFYVDGLFTHFATADEKDIEYYSEQKNKFNEIVKTFKKSINHPTIVHAGNSAASMRFPHDTYDAVRFGISMYGLYPSDYVKREEPIQLEPAFTLHSQLVHVKRVPKGEAISYGRTYNTESDIWVGTVPLGYADGWIRKHQGYDVLVDGKRLPIIGRVCMDQFMIKLDRQYPLGTIVTLIGKQQEEEITVDEVASRLETINYEIPCMISLRVPRVFKSGDKKVWTENRVLE